MSTSILPLDIRLLLKKLRSLRGLRGLGQELRSLGQELRGSASQELRSSASLSLHSVTICLFSWLKKLRGQELRGLSQEEEYPCEVENCVAVMR